MAFLAWLLAPLASSIAHTLAALFIDVIFLSPDKMRAQSNGAYMLLQMQWTENYIDVPFGLKKCRWRATKYKFNIISGRKDVKIVKLVMCDLLLYSLIL